MMPDIQLPDGTIGRFPDGLGDDEIAQVLAKQFPPANGAKVVFVEDLQRFAVYDVAGKLCGLRRDLDAAKELAASIKAAPPPRAPRGVAPAAVPTDPVPFFVPRESRPLPAHRPPRVLLSRSRNQGTRP